MGTGVACRDSDTVKIGSAGISEVGNLTAIHYLVINAKAFPINIFEKVIRSIPINFPYTRKKDSKNRHTERMFDMKAFRTTKKKSIRSRQSTGNIRSAEIMCPRNLSANGCSVLKESRGVCVSERRVSARKCIQHLVFQDNVLKSTLT